MTIDARDLSELIHIALREDCFTNDVTANAAIDKGLRAQAQIYSKEPLVFCGIPVVERTAEIAGVDLEIVPLVEEGQWCEHKTALLNLSGPAHDLLRVERILLNFLQRLSGVASVARQFSEAAKPVKVYDTRKTTPGWRYLEKYAVAIGGGTNHRMNLSDLILVKNNHIDANAGDIHRTLQAVFENKDTAMKVEVEVRDLGELATTLKFPVDVVMLDNIRGPDLLECVAQIRATSKSILIEGSGNVTLDSLSEFKSAGVDAVSTSQITAAAVPVDIAMSITYE